MKKIRYPNAIRPCIVRLEILISKNNFFSKSIESNVFELTYLKKILSSKFPNLEFFFRFNMKNFFSKLEFLYI
jgi:hypothetical protein